MNDDERPPPIPEKMNVPLKVGAVLIGYLLYRILLEDEVAGPLFVAAGFVVLAYAVINRSTTWSRDRSGMLQAGTTILGLGLLVLGALVLLTG
ncbi:MAG: hypothetical protein ACRDLB_07610 [Actinomycetota bacterium]